MKLSGYDPWGLPSTSITPKPNPTSPTLICHDLATQLNQTFISQPYLDGSPRNFQHRPTVGKQIWSDPKPDPTSPSHLTSFVMTYHDLATQLNQTFISQPNLDGSPGNFQHMTTVGKQIWSDPQSDPTSPTLICHNLSWSSHPIKSNLLISAKSWWISMKFSA